MLGTNTSPSNSSRRLAKGQQHLKFWVLMLFAAYIGWFFLDEDLSLAEFGRFSPSLLLSLCAMTFLSFVLRFLRWHWLLVSAGFSVPIRWNFQCYLAGFAFTATPGKSGEMVRSVYLEQRDVPYASSLGLFVCDRFCDLVAIIIWGLIFAFSFGYIDVKHIAGLLILSFIPLMLVRSTALDSRLDHWRQTHASRVIAVVCDFLFRFKSSLSFYLSPRRFALCLLISMLAWAIIGLELKFLLSAINIDVKFVDAMGVSAAGLLAGAVSLIPGGVGVNELVQSKLLLELGVSQTDSIVVTWVGRLCTLWFALACGALCLISLRLDRRN